MGEDEGGDVAWRQILNDLKDGKLVTIPVTDDHDAQKKRQQLTKRAERHGFQVEVEATGGALQARRTSEIDPTVQRGAGADDREARREQRRAGRGGSS